MRTVYHFKDFEYTVETTGHTLVANGYGGFYCLCPELSYEGWFEFNNKPWDIHKSIASLTPLDEGSQHTLHHQLYGIRRSYDSHAEDMIIPHGDTLLYMTQGISGRVLLALDNRKAYDPSLLGRYYTISEENNSLFIYFHGEQGEQWLCLKGYSNVQRLENWQETHYAIDAQRQTPDTYWTYHAFTFTPTAHTVIARAKTKAEAQTRADVSQHHFQDILTQKQEELAPPVISSDNHVQAAYELAVWSLQQTTQQFTYNHTLLTGIYAGLPWFFQLWSRDELISLEASSYKKTILNRYLPQLETVQEISNRFPPTTLASVDALGWLAKRLYDSILLEETYTQDELTRWHTAFVNALDYAKKTRGFPFGNTILFTNKSQETWMDTIYEDDGRAGIRIEIQALYDCVYAVINLLAKKTKRQNLRKEQQQFQAGVRELFVDTTILDGINQDGSKDKRIRPNVFIALYLSPQLFDKSTWKKTCDDLLAQLLLPWGGLATLDSQNPLFSPSYTGENNKSYHRGDSWYFVNNLAAIALHRLDKNYYAREINALTQASIKDILQLGFAGHASELSSAQMQTGEASPVQSWSSATLIELLQERFNEE